MFYRPESGHGLLPDPHSAQVRSRPIGWISAVDTATRHNLAPFALFNIVAYRPPQIR